MCECLLSRILNMEPKRLYRSQTNKIFAGVCGGLGEYFNIDAGLLRLLWVLVVIFTGFFPGVIAYIIAIFIIPLSPQEPVHAEYSTVDKK